jgi:hypothetical protein
VILGALSSVKDKVGRDVPTCQEMTGSSKISGQEPEAQAVRFLNPDGRRWQHS